MAENMISNREHLRNEQMVQLPLEGFLRPPKSIGLRLRLVARGKILWEAFRFPNTGSTLIMDPMEDRVRVIHWNNPEELIKEKTRRYIPI